MASRRIVSNPGDAVVGGGKFAYTEGFAMNQLRPTGSKRRERACDPAPRRGGEQFAARSISICRIAG